MSFATGPYSICRVEPQDLSDGLIYVTLSWGYDSEEDAVANAKRVASDNNVPIDDIAIVKSVFAFDLNQEHALPDSPVIDRGSLAQYFRDIGVDDSVGDDKCPTGQDS